MKPFNIYLTGVGGQGIGLLSEVLLRASDHAGHKVKSVDTHGLAQRGGIVKSQIRIGDGVHSPLIPAGTADLAIALERHEAMRAMDLSLRDKGTLIYYNTVWQPLAVRLNQSREITETDLSQKCEARGVRLVTVFDPSLSDIRMQNMVVLAGIYKYRLVPGIELKHYFSAMEDLMAGAMLDKNRDLFKSWSGPS